MSPVTLVPGSILARYKRPRSTRPAHPDPKERIMSERATAAAAGASATENFRATNNGAANTSPERLSALVHDVLRGVHATIRENNITYPEYNALKAWLIEVGQGGEWPLLLDVFVEHVVEEVATADRSGSKGSIEGPFYVPGAPEFGADATLPMRDDEPGIRLTLHGQVRGVDGTALRGARLDIWQDDANGVYSQFGPNVPEWNLRGVVTADENGRFRIRTIKPVPYEIPTEGATGTLIRGANWAAFRPAHLHLRVSAAGHQQIISQLYFPGDPHNETDVADAVKPELIVNPTPTADGIDVEYDFILDPS
jgi:catechol 1,2-dioxygenase